MIRLHVLFKALVGCLMLMTLSSLARAVEVTDLYQASVAVDNRSISARNAAVRAGLLDVLVKVSGSSLIAQQDAIRDARQDAERFVVQYGYETREIPAAEEGARPQKRIYLNIKYDVVAVNQFLRRNGFPIWASNRASLTLWLAYDGGNGRRLVGGDVQTNLQALAQVHASRRGLPITFPNYDSQDRSRVSPGDIWGLFADPVVEASRRYDSNAVALVRMSNNGGIVNLNSVVIIDGREQWWDHSSATLDDAVADLVDQLADRVGEYYAVAVSEELGQQVLLDVSGVDNLKDFAQLGEYLEGLIAVRESFPEKVKGSRVRYLVTLENNTQALEQSFRLDKKLIPVEAPKPASLNKDEQSSPKSAMSVPMGAAIESESGLSEQSMPAEEVSPEQSASPLMVTPETAPSLPVIYYQWQG